MTESASQRNYQWVNLICEALRPYIFYLCKSWEITRIRYVILRLSFSKYIKSYDIGSEKCSDIFCWFKWFRDNIFENKKTRFAQVVLFCLQQILINNCYDFINCYGCTRLLWDHPNNEGLVWLLFCVFVFYVVTKNAVGQKINKHAIKN